ncbi:MAG: hypothetical protein FWG42_05100 [Clostridiales bacterium]|nr:hypothetical protein [Clostridiales bacterium]
MIGRTHAAGKGATGESLLCRSAGVRKTSKMPANGGKEVTLLLGLSQARMIVLAVSLHYTLLIKNAGLANGTNARRWRLRRI